MFSLFITFLKIGLFTFGGGYAMISQIKESVVDKKAWLTEEQMTEVIAIAESTPGPIAINLATYVGYKHKGVWGSIVATLGVILPSMTILYLVSLFLGDLLQNEYVGYAFVGIKCAVAFLILKAGVQMLGKMKKDALAWVTFAVVLVAMLLFELFAVSFSAIVFIVVGGVMGLVYYGVYRAKKDKEGKEE